MRVLATVDFGSFKLKQAWEALPGKGGLFLRLDTGSTVAGFWIDPKQLKPTEKMAEQEYPGVLHVSNAVVVDGLEDKAVDDSSL